MRSCIWTLALCGCWGSNEPMVPPDVAPPPAVAASEPASPAAPAVDPEQAALAQADAAIDALRTRLKARLIEVMGSQGPAAAVQVCAEEAGRIAEEVGATHGATVGRASLRMRNTSRPIPAWVSTWLQVQGERPADGTRGLRESDREPHAGHARVLAPLTVEAPCLTCHGPQETIPPAVRAILEQRYPDDEATGYALGDLRGAVWAEATHREPPPG